METNQNFPRWIPLTLAVLLSVAAANSAFASRMFLPMGDNIRQSELIVIGDTWKGEGGPLDLIISVSNVIKGDKKFIGKDIELRGRMLSTADVRVSHDEKGIALLFPESWEKSDKWPLVEAYREPARIAALKALIDVIAIEDERKRLRALQKLCAEGDPDIQKSTFSELRGMRNPDNFDLLIQWFDELEAEHQADLIRLMAQTMGDQRCVPTLIKALSSSVLEVRTVAAHGLYFHFPGSPGIAEAFHDHLQTEGVAQLAARYLAIRYDNPEFAELVKPGDKRWLKAQQLEKEGKAEVARKLYFELITDEAESDYVRRSTTAKLIQDAGPDELTRIRKILLPFLRQDVSGDSYIDVLRTTRILRALRHPDCLPALIEVFQHQGLVYKAAIREACMAIDELDDEARQKAAQRLFEIIQVPPKKHVTGNSGTSHLLALIWLANEAAFSEARKTMDPAFRQRWPAMAFLAGLPRAEDEAAFLIERLKGSEKKAIDHKAQEWIVFRLGDLKDTRAVPVLATLIARPYSRPAPLILKAALTSIGGAEAEAAMLKLLTHKDPGVRRTATDILCALQGPEAMPLCRRILTEENFGSKIDTLYPIGRHGSLEDLELLEELCDYWTGDRSLTYHGGNAMAQIRERIHYDLNGPIVKAGRFVRPTE